MITIRTATAADTDIIAEIIRLSVLDSYAHFMPADFMTKFMEGDRAGYLARRYADRFHIAERNTVPAGVMLLKTDYIDHLWTHPDHMGRGVGTALIEHAEAVAAATGITKLTLDCFEKNVNALAFYRARGFTLERKYTATETAPGEPVCLLAKVVIPGAICPPC